MGSLLSEGEAVLNVLHCRKSCIGGELIIPSSKSHSHRAILFGAMAKGKTTLRRLLRSPDTEGMLALWKILGANIAEEGDCVTIEGLAGKIDGADDVIDVGNSGIALRFLTALASLSEKPIVITGDSSIRHHRPMAPLLKALNQLGVEAISTRGDGYAPIIVKGPLRGGEATVNGRDSQPVSALLIASPFAEGKTTIAVHEAGELPWIELTLSWLDRLNIAYSREGFERYELPGGQSYEGFDYLVPGDWSSAAFPAAAALVAKGSVTLHNLDKSDAQGDKRLFDLFEEMGGSVRYDAEKKSVEVGYKGPLRGITADINDCIDAITTLAAVACFAKGETKIVNASVAREKECDRIDCIANELSKMGADIEVKSDGLLIRGAPLFGKELSSHNDHRMAMSLAVAAFGAEGASAIEGAACIAKTYPTFIEEMRSLGAHLL